MCRNCAFLLLWAGTDLMRCFLLVTLVSVRISVNVTAHFANNVTGGFTRLRGV